MRVLPAVRVGQSTAAVLNIHLTLEEALKLNLAIDECARKVNAYNRATTVGKARGVNLAVNLRHERINVLEGKV